MVGRSACLVVAPVAVDSFAFLFVCVPVGRVSGWIDGWLVVLGLTALSDSISVYIGPSPKEREKEKRKDRGE